MTRDPVDDSPDTGPDTDTDPEQTVRAIFGRLVGGSPDGVWAAPGRVNLIGEHVDYAGGRCLPFALRQRTWVAARRRDDGLLRVASAQRPDDPWQGTVAEAGTAPGWAGYAAGVVWALHQDHSGLDSGLNSGLDLVVDGRVPTGAGLSSSAALECAVALAWSDLTGAVDGDGRPLSSTDAGRATLAASCVRAENEVAGAPTGGMDQAASLRCGEGAVLALDCADGSARPLPFDPSAAGLALLVIDTRAQHALGDGQYGARRADVEAAAKTLGVRWLGRCDADADQVVRDLIARGTPDRVVRRARHVVTEVARVDAVVDLLRRSTFDPSALRAIGPHLDASHTSLRDDHEVSCLELDLAVATARQAGALGARMTGGGFGGSAIALVEADRQETVAAAVTQAFAAAGLTPPVLIPADPGPGAQRVS